VNNNLSFYLCLLLDCCYQLSHVHCWLLFWVHKEEEAFLQVHMCGISELKWAPLFIYLFQQRIRFLCLKVTQLVTWKTKKTNFLKHFMYWFNMPQIWPFFIITTHKALFSLTNLYYYLTINNLSWKSLCSYKFWQVFKKI